MKLLFGALNFSPLTGDQFDYMPVVLLVLAAVAIVAVLFFLKKGKPK